MKSVTRLLIKIFAWIYYYSYHKISALSVIENGGIHPKHQINNYHQFFIDNVQKDDVVLDVGCGDGINALRISKYVKKIVAIDIVESRVKLASVRSAAKNIIYLVRDATTYDFSEKFDKIILSNVLEHIKDRTGFLKSLHKLSDFLLIRVPMISRDWAPMYLKSLGIDYRMDPTHETEYTIAEFEKEMENSQWKILKKTVQFGEIWAVVKKA